MKEKIENGPLRIRTYIVYLNMESDKDTIMDYIIDPVAGSPSRNRVVNHGNVCMRVDDLIVTGTHDFLCFVIISTRAQEVVSDWLAGRE